MVYDSLLLGCGGGIIPHNLKSPQYKGSATLAIGLGGTGVAALSTLKGKIHRQLLADDPDAPTPQYAGIQLLAIDSDESDYFKYRGNCRLTANEFYSICDPQIANHLRTKTPIVNDPFLNWMDIEGISCILSPDGAGGIRQIGRYLLFKNVDRLERTIEAKCSTALRSRGAQSLDIYIFAGISGGTGSGCFLDTCYIVRKIVENNGWNAKIMGYFFLPDVVTSKPAVANNAAARAYNEANSYAALKELDYLMRLKDNQDWFTQSYSAALKVHTQDAPVDMCHLISATQPDGEQIPDGFHYALNIATDYVMSFLADITPEGGNGADNGLTLRGHLANVIHAMFALPSLSGANLRYHIGGSCKAQIPTDQIHTYLACGFFDKFTAAVGDKASCVLENDVKFLYKQLKLTAEDICHFLKNQAPDLQLPELDRKIFAKCSVPAPGSLNAEWAQVGNNWLDQCAAALESNSNVLSAPLNGFEKGKTEAGSLIGRVFDKLWEISLDSYRGPYYAAKLLKNGSYDLDAALTGSIHYAEEQSFTCRAKMASVREGLEEAKNSFYKKPTSGNYTEYQNAVSGFYECAYQLTLVQKTVVVLRKFQEMLKELYTRFFKPLTDMLDNLRDTFLENRIYLNSSAYLSFEPCTQQIITLAELEPMLNQRLKSLTNKELVTSFVEPLLINSDFWLTGDSDGITMLVRKFMTDLFKKESERSLQDYLVQKYPDTKEPRQLAAKIAQDILDKLHAAAAPIFWCDPAFNLNNTFASNTLSVPAAATAVSTAADYLLDLRPTERYTIRKTGLGDSICAIRLCTGVPLYAYQGITQMKKYYDQAENTPAGVGNHLYAKTGRGTDGSGEKDWRHYLPEPTPYSLLGETSPEAEELLKLYELAWEKGILATDKRGSFVLQLTEPVTIREYTPEDFTVDGVYDREAYRAERRRLHEQLEAPFTPSDTIRLLDDGNTSLDEQLTGRCRLDAFMAAPVLQQLVREELEKPAIIAKNLEYLINFRHPNQATPPQVTDTVPAPALPPIPQAPAMVLMQTPKGLLWIVGNDHTRGWNGAAWINL